MALGARYGSLVNASRTSGTTSSSATGLGPTIRDTNERFGNNNQIR